MLKPVLAATAALAIAGSSIVYAQQRYGGSGDEGGFRAEHRHQLSAEDRAAFADARIAALKAGLELTSDQAKNWPAFEQSLREMVQLRMQRRQAREAGNQQPPTSPFERLARRADSMAKVSAAMKRIADTGAPLYMSLDDTQKDRFKMLSHLLRPHHHHHHDMHAGNGGWRDGGGWREGHGYGRNGGDWRGENGFGRDGGRWHQGPGFGREGRRFGQDQGPGGRFHELMDNEDQDSQL